jgi:MFS family permease
VAIPGVFLAIFIGYVADLRGRRFIAIASLLVYGIAGVAGFFVRSFWPLVIVRAIQGLGTSGILSLGVVVIGDVFPPGRERRWALGLNSAGLTVTGMVSPILGGWLATSDVFRPFLVYALALPIAVWARRLPGRPEGEPPAPPLAHVRSMFGELRSSGRLADFAGLLPFSLIVMVVFMGIGFTVTPLFLEREFGVGSTQRGMIQAILSAGSSAASLSASRLAQRYSARRLLSTAFAVIAVGFLAIGLAPNLWPLGVGLALLGIGVGISFPLIQDFVASAVPGVYRGAAVGTWISSIRLGQAAGPVIGAGLADGIGERTTYGIAAASAGLILVAWQPLRRVADGWINADADADPNRRPLIR